MLYRDVLWTDHRPLITSKWIADAMSRFAHGPFARFHQTMLCVVVVCCGCSNVNLASYVAAPWLVQHKMTDFLAAADSDGSDPIAVAAIYYGRCLWIHPFEDGNGSGVRVASGWVEADILLNGLRE